MLGSTGTLGIHQGWVGESRGGEAGQVASALPQIARQRGEVRRGLKEGWRGKWGETESQAEAEVGMSGTRNSWGPCVQTSNQSGPGIPPIAWAGARHTQARGGPLGGPALPAAGLEATEVQAQARALVGEPLPSHNVSRGHRGPPGWARTQSTAPKARPPVRERDVPALRVGQ